jgi:hypothetical protein
MSLDLEKKWVQGLGFSQVHHEFTLELIF